MGKLYDAVKTLDRLIDEAGLDSMRTRGLIGMKAGFFLVMVTPDSPDDPQRLEALRQAASEVLGRTVVF
jgi:hypothetical protein